MPTSGDASGASEDIAEAYDRDGFVFPLDVVSEAEARELRGDYEAAEAELAGDPQRLALLRSYPDRLLPSFDRVIRHPRILDAVPVFSGPLYSKVVSPQRQRPFVMVITPSGCFVSVDHSRS